MRTLLNLICVMACLAGGACSNDAPATVEPASPPPPPVPSSVKSDDSKSNICAALRAEIDARRSLRVLVTLDGSLEDQAALDATHKAVQAELPAGSTADVRVMGISFVATIQPPALEALCASPRVVMVRKPRIGTLA